MRYLPALILLAMPLLAACGGAGPTTDLVVDFRPDAGSDWRSSTLLCDPVGGTMPNSEAACKTLADLVVEDLAPTSPQTACTMIYGGPQQARVRGILHGREVDATFSLSDGCEIARWKLLVDVLPPAGH